VKGAGRRGRAAALLLGVAGGLVLAVPVALADGHGARLTLDNDQFNFWQVPDARPDFGYTHGVELAFHAPRAPASLARLAPAWLVGGKTAERSLEVRVRQAIYSPWTNPPDRPYAGWLELALGLAHTDLQASREVLLHVGVTGPPSQAGATQRYFHRRFDKGEPPDWSGQLPAEPGIGLEASAARLTRAPETTWQSFGGWFVRARAGTYALDLRLGATFSAGLGPPRPWPAPAPTGSGPALYLRWAPRLDLIARDEFLDGTLFRSSAAPGANPVVPESEFVIGTGWGHARLEWSVLRRGKEFEAQPGPHTYGSLALTWLP